MPPTRRPRRAPLLPPERLEQRTSLTAAAPSIGPAPRPLPHASSAEVGHRQTPAAISDHNPLRERVVAGLVYTAYPHFYKLYTGPRLSGLEARVATAHLVPGRGFVFTGTTAGPVDPSAPASFVFDVDRGGASAPGPYPQRSDVYFDATVTVNTGPGGVSGNVTLLGPDGSVASQTALSAQNLAVRGRTVSVTVDPALLPPTSTPRTRLKLTEYRFNLHVQYGAGGPETIASFVPEYSLAPFAIPRL